MFMLCKTLQAAYGWQEGKLAPEQGRDARRRVCLLAVLEHMPDSNNIVIENMPNSNNIIKCWISNAWGSIKLPGRQLLSQAATITKHPVTH